VQWHKDFKALREDHFATRLPRLEKSHTHMSKTRHTKRTQLVATVRFTIHAFFSFSDWKESNVTVWGAVRKNIISDRFSTKTAISVDI